MIIKKNIQTAKQFSLTSKRIPWVDFAKGIAILAVIFDHCFQLVYSNKTILDHTIFSVSLFVFIAGVTSAVSLEKSDGAFLVSISRRIKRIVYPYLLSRAS